ncbi:tryptophan-rich sensory protein [Candidatus Woesearchaeota archaeon]|nr:tryptophan-rich sensory protein [Candidatus Woesearchaeota archaeon]
MKNNQKLSIPKLVASIALCQLAGIIGSVFTASSVSTWYATLQKPSFNPPGWVFGPVWTLLYLLMGISFYLIWNKSDNFRKKGAKVAASAFGIQLALNVLWSLLFFGLKSPIAAFVCIVALWLAVLVTIMKFNRISKAAAMLLMPYLLWVSFAALLNFSIVLLNI